MSEPTPRSAPRTPPPGPRNKDADQQPWRVEGSRDPERPRAGGNGGDGQRPRFRFPRWLLWVTLGLLLLNILVARQVPENADRIDVPFSFFQDQVQAGDVTKVNAQGDIIQGEFDEPKKPADAGKNVEPKRKFETTLPTFVDTEQLSEDLEEQNVEVNAEQIDTGRSPLLDFFLFFGPTILLVGLFVFFMRRAAGGAGGALTGLGRSKAKRYEADQQRTTFEDVAGIDEAEEELVEIVDFLKNPDK